MVGRADGTRATGRPPLTERRRAETRMEIAEEAVRLFSERGVAATTAEDIALAVGMSARTLWRYFRSKEECVRPLLSLGVETLFELLRDCPADRPLAEVMTNMPYDDSGQRRLNTMRDLVRLCHHEPGLRAVWLETHYDAEASFAALIAERTARSADDLEVRLEAGALNTALRIAVEHWSLRPDDVPGPSFKETADHALRRLRTFTAYDR
ncbi:TetR/AcrR family transcriptional regulator [Streptomyces sp. 4F14]|uniref:TetR/AcrR family transcriptional regulator n=1 Tax=Streptomyces sp. 4F14 TaxID=3394380 RepID=UPI003A854204